MSVSFWLTRVKQVTSASQDLNASLDLAALFSLDLNDPQVSSLQNDILDNGVPIEDEVDATELYDGDWPGFVELAKSYLRFARDVNPEDIPGSFDLYAQFLTDLQSAFANSRGAILAPIVPQSGRIIVPQAIALDSGSGIQVEHTAAVLLKMFNSIRAEKLDPTQGEVLSKKPVILYVAAVLCRLYFNMNQPGSCANVFSNIHTANIKFSLYNRAQRVEYRYWLGRFYLNKYQLSSAYRHLSWAFNNCLNSATRNRRIIFIYLVPVSLLLGKLPSQQALQYFGVEREYGPLVDSFKRSDYARFMNQVESSQWLYDHGLVVLLKSRAPVVLYRGVLLKLCRVLSNAGTPASTVSFDHLQKALSVSTGSPSPIGTDEGHLELETICVSLISQGFVKANIFARNQVLRLKPVNAMPRLVDLYRIGTGASLELSGQERWMEQ